MVGRLVGRFAGLKAGWLVCWSDGRLVGSLADWQVGRFIYIFRFAGRQECKSYKSFSLLRGLSLIWRKYQHTSSFDWAWHVSCYTNILRNWLFILHSCSCSKKVKGNILARVTSLYNPFCSWLCVCVPVSLCLSLWVTNILATSLDVVHCPMMQLD